MLNPFDSTELAALNPSWRGVVETFAVSERGLALQRFLAAQSQQIIYPPQPLRALILTSLARTRVVILGQDPYHGPGQAHGLAFSVPTGVRLPPSLRNIYKELGKSLTHSGDLTRWAEQGVLLLNCVLTVQQAAAASHAKQGWETLTDTLIATAAQHAAPKVFLLWGNYAQSKAGLIAEHPQHLVLQANHPSPLSALRPPVPFMGCGHFAQANAFLQQHDLAPIDW